MKKILIPLLFLPLLLTACNQNPNQPAAAVTTKTLNALSQAQFAEQNKKIVTDFYEGVF